MLSRQPDPVFVGETRSALALWSAGIFERFGITSFVHVRAIHYRVISQPWPLLLPNGKPYRNHVECFDDLAGAPSKPKGQQDRRRFAPESRRASESDGADQSKATSH